MAPLLAQGEAVVDAHVFALVPAHEEGITIDFAGGAVAKRAFDVVVAALSVVVLLPLFALVALAVRLDSRGPVFYRQRRVGRDGDTFEMFKFRSMVDGAHDMRRVLEPFNEAVGGLFKLTYDPRVTRIGRIIRKLHLDELPQLLNVIRGEMTFVGPRPLVPEEDALIPARFAARRSITPGITGPWQVGKAHSIGLPEMAEMDIRYAQQWSLTADLVVLGRTAVHVLAARGR